MADRRRLSDRGRTALAAVLGAALLGGAYLLHDTVDLVSFNRRYVALSLGMLAVCAAAAALLWRHARRRDVAIVLAVALVARALVAFDDPTLSDDAYRFVWDGRVQAHGIDPYAHAPAAAALRPLRDFDVFPQVNRPFTRTAYPPTDQIAFYAIRRVAGEGVRQVKLAFVVSEAAVVALLLALLARTGRSAGRVALYAWHPLAITEIASSGHPEPLLMALLLAALLAWDRGHAVRAGAALGAAVLAKFVPLLAAPFMFRRLGMRFVAAAALAAGAIFAPYGGAGTAALGSVDAYQREHFGAGPFRWLTDAGLSAGVSRSLLLVALAAAVAASAWRPPRDLPAACATTALLLFGAMLASSTVQPWYLLWVLPLLCVTPTPGLLWAAGTVCTYYLTFGPDKSLSQDAASLVVWAPALLLLAGATLRSRRPPVGADRRPPSRAPAPV